MDSPFDSMGPAYADYGVELSSPARGVVVWALLRELGEDGVRAIVRRDTGYARRLADRVRDAPEPRAGHRTQALDLLLPLRAGRAVADDAQLDVLNTTILSRLRRDTPYAPSSTVVGGRFAIRPCYINSRTTPADVDGLADAVVDLGDQLAGD